MQKKFSLKDKIFEPNIKRRLMKMFKFKNVRNIMTKTLTSLHWGSFTLRYVFNVSKT